MYLGPIAIARYSYVQKEVPTKTCQNGACKNFHKTSMPGDYCNMCGTKMENAYIAKIVVPKATPRDRDGIFYYRDGDHRHYYVLDGMDARRFERLIGLVTVYPATGDFELIRIPEILDITSELEQMRAKNHQALIDAGYDSVEYVFGLLLPEEENEGFST